MAKYGAKFKAAFGGRPRPVAQKPAPKPQGAPAPAARPKPAPAPKAPQAAPASAPAAYPDGTDGANAVWDAFGEANKGVKQADLEEQWFSAIDKHSNGKDQADMSGEQWAAVAAELLGEAADDGSLPF